MKACERTEGGREGGQAGKYQTGLGVRELSPGVAREHVDDCNLTPFVHVHNEAAELSEVPASQKEPD